MYSEVFDVTTGDDHTCASFDGQVKCWGSNAYSQLANGDIVQRMIPVTAHQLSNTVASISAGSLHTCAVTSNGAAYCWGKNTNGQLGGGGQTDSSGTPMAVSGISGGVSSIAAGSGYSCVVVNGGVKCWGANNSGGLGDGTYTTRLTPVDATGLTSGVTKVVVGWDGHTCALTTSGGVKCWGNNANGQAGTGDFYNTPVDVSGVTSEIADVAAGNFQTCVLTQSGGVKCWGLIVYDGGSQQNNTPTQVSGLESGVKAIAAGFSFACAITNTNGVKCWGNNTYGQLGNGSTTPSLTPVNVSGLSSDVKAISLGANHACAITNTNGVKCWGKGANLGNGSYTNNSTPVNVSGLTSGVQAISAGSTHTCAILLNGLVKCWGFDGYGQLAIGTNPINPVPVNMTSLIPPTLEINFPVGYIGSYFTLTGANFPPSSVLSVSVNGEMLTDNLQVDETGGFIFILSTESADLGDYMVKVNETAGGGIMAAMMANPTAIFKLRDSAPLREKEGGAMTLSVPSGLAQTISFIFVPVVSNR